MDLADLGGSWTQIWRWVFFLANWLMADAPFSGQACDYFLSLLEGLFHPILLLDC